MNDLKSKNHEIVLKSAPPAVAKELMDQGYSLDVTPQGVKVYKI